MKAFTTIASTCVPLPHSNVDTDQIIPARFLKATSREGFGENLFRDWRYDQDGNPVEGFVLNDPTWQGEILLAGDNFGCGSSREHAAWAISDYGFRAVISSSFADIFRNNSLNNGLLPVEVNPEILTRLFDRVKSDPGFSIHIDLPAQKIWTEDGIRESFEIDPYKKECMVNGLTDIDYLLNQRDDIEKYETTNRNVMKA